ncbi:MAG: MarR family winged helix-turn-helix transcriptional regulator [Acidimicrobiia bacterium]
MSTQSNEKVLDIGEPSPEVLNSPEFVGFLATLDAATSIIGATDQILRDADLGISTREFDALIFVIAFGPIRPSDLLRKVVLTHSVQTLASTIDRLEQAGLVHRSPHPTNKAAVLVEATAEGRSVVQEVFPFVYRTVIQPFSSRYSDADIAALGDLLTRK